jgi:PST family polysaccharide transporter
MDFRLLGWAEVGQAVANGAVALPLAWRGWGVWSLAAGFVAGTAVYTILVFVFARWRPGIRFTRADARGLLPFGLGVTGANLAYAFRSYVDKYLVGRFLGAAALGGYQLAFRIVTAPEQRVAWLVSRVIFPGLAAIQGDDERIGRIWRKALTVIGLIAAPALAAVAVCADDFVLVVFGPPWRFIVPALRIMSVAGVFFALGSTAGTVFLAKGRADVEFRISVVNTVLLALALVFGVRFGVAGVAWAVVGQAAMGYVLALATAMALIRMTAASLVRALAAPAVVTAAVAAAAFCFRGAVAAAPPLRLAGALGAAGVAYAGALWLLRVKELAEVLDFVKAKWREMRAVGRDVPAPAEEVG